MAGADFEPGFSVLSTDAQEQDRRGLEQVINGDLDSVSLILTSVTDDPNNSIEYPRNGPRHSPLPFDPYSSFARSFNDLEFSAPEPHHYVQDYKQHQRHYSYRMDDSYGMGGDTGSTDGHHRSEITFGAGLRGIVPSHSPREGREYDPDRQVDRLIGNRGHMSMFDDAATPRSQKRVPTGNSSRSRHANKSRDIHLHTVGSHPTFDPVIVDDTVELDRAVESGHLQFNNVPPIPQSNGRTLRNNNYDDDTVSQAETDSSSFRRSDPPTPATRPKLSDALGRVTDDRFLRKAPSPPPSQPSTHDASGQTASTGSRFGKMAKGLAREIEDTRREEAAWDEANARAQRHPFIDILNHPGDGTRIRRNPPLRTTAANSSKLQLPDVTGLTAAADTPTKSRVLYAAVTAHQPESEHLRELVEVAIADLRQTKRQNFSKLEQGLAELREELKRRDHERSFRLPDSPVRNKKGKQRQEPVYNQDEDSFREEQYQRILDEKNTLEQLVTNLRDYITDLSRKLRNSQLEVEELRLACQRDAEEIQKKSAEVDKLSVEVRELSGEVTRLRHIILEGVQATREAQQSMIHPLGDLSTVQEVSNEDLDNQTYNQYQRPGEYRTTTRYSPPSQDDGSETETEIAEEDAEDIRQQSLVQGDASIEYTLPNIARPTVTTTLSSNVPTQRTRSGSVASAARPSSRLSNRAPSPQYGHGISQPDPAARRAPSRLSAVHETGREDDISSVSSFGKPLPMPSRRFINDDELRRLREDVEERRSERSVEQSNADDDSIISKASSDPGPQAPALSQPPRLSKQKSVPAVPSGSNAPPVPHIHGQVRKLFLAPDRHDHDSCDRCRHRKRRDEAELAGAQEWVATFLRRRTAKEYARKEEGCDGVEDDDSDPAPPQTVLARVVREMEDDFLHHKSIYIELAQQYALMDAVSNVAKRNVLAEHLHEIIEALERTGDQIASLYGLLHFKDQPLQGRCSPPVNA
ncbi:hypothetical protein FRB99_002512 [Tulasnella sp. 403]|nr:hypothetical protein FRB99_002512 [Tulasnella sp. 403]